MKDADVLIAGAGPTGLVLALWLTRLGVRVRIVDKSTEAGTTSRALAVQARTLEFYHQVGLSDAVVAQGTRTLAVNAWVAGKRMAHAVLGDLGEGLSPFPFVLIFPQDEHERFLIERLAELGVTIERNTELLGFDESGEQVRATLRGPDGASEQCLASYVAGCDGAHSAVRAALQIGFPGGTYAHTFYVADIEGRGDVLNGELHIGLDRSDFLAVFPLARQGHARLVGTLRDEPGGSSATLTWNDVSRQVLEWMNIEVSGVNWFSTYRVHHRVAEHFAQKRAFLLGDAAHIHSPVGGQGMNTGIGDAVNLAWKLAAVVQGRAVAALLETFEPERIAFARRLVATTDRAFTAGTSDGAMARFLRMQLVPRMAPLLISMSFVRRLMFRTVSQTGVNYRGGALASGQAGAVHGGDRLPWVRLEDGRDNFSVLTALDWQVHVYGAARADLARHCAERGLSLHVFPWTRSIAAVGLARDALYLLRPDGYVGLADASASVATLHAYLEARGIVARPAA